MADLVKFSLKNCNPKKMFQANKDGKITETNDLEQDLGQDFYF